MKAIILIVSFFLLGFAVQAQQEAMYSQYMFNHFVINPAVAGTHELIPVRLTARQQWVGIADAPSTQMLSAHTSLGIEQKIGVGGILYNDHFGPLSRTGIEGVFAYNFKISSETKLSLGVSMSVFQFRLNESELNIIDPSDAVINGENRSVIVPDADFGAYLYHKKYFVGLSVTQMIQYPFGLNGYGDLRKQLPHFYLDGGYKFEVSEKLELEPSIMLKKTGPVPLQFDINSRLIYQKDYWFGLSFRYQDAVVAMLGMRYERFIIGYAYDYTLSNLNSYSNGTHEIMLGIDLGHARKPSMPQL